MHGTIGLHEQFALVPPQAFAARMEQHWINNLELTSSPALRQQWFVTAATFRQAITDTAENHETPWRILQPPTGSGKTQGAIVYAAMQAELNSTSQLIPVGILIVTRLIDQANEIAAQINNHAGRDVAVAHHSAKPATAEELHQSDVLVITHQAYVNASESLSNHQTTRWKLLTQWRGGQRLLTIIDEALANVVEHYQITAADLAKVIGYTSPDIRLSYPKQVAALEALHALLMSCAETTASGSPQATLVWDHTTSPPPECVDLSLLREAMRKLPYDRIVLGEERDADRVKIAKRVDEALQEAQAITERWAYYAQQGKEHSINSSEFLIPPCVPGPVVLDATANSNFLWDLLEGRACIIPTPPNVRDYSNVTLHVARASGLGKHSMIKRAQTRVPGVLSALEREIGPGRSVLMITHKATEHIPATFEHNFAHLHVAHWGAIDGRNDWSDCDTAVIVGLPYRDYIWATNLFCAFQGPQDDTWMQEPAWEGHKNVLKVMEQKQLSLSIIQAINRVRCRRVIDAQGRSPLADIFVILPKDKAGDAVLSDIHADMPGLKEVEWDFELDGPKVRKPRKGSSHEALIKLMANRLPGETPMPLIRRELGLNERQLKRLKEVLRTKHHATTQELLRMGVHYEATRVGRGAKAFLIKEPPPHAL